MDKFKTNMDVASVAPARKYFRVIITVFGLQPHILTRAMPSTQKSTTDYTNMGVKFRRVKSFYISASRAIRGKIIVFYRGFWWMRH